MSFHRIGLFWNPAKVGGIEAARIACGVMRGHGLTPAMDSKLASVLNLHKYATEDFSDCDLLMVFGGDGTLLTALAQAVPNDIPMLGVNLGRMGFLTEVEPEALEQDMKRLLEGDYRVEERMMMELAEPAPQDFFALNEIVVTRSMPSLSILSLEIEADGVLVDRISGDGLIVASATGSTAYSLSAGGPIVSPGLDCFVLTPVCAHTMNARPVVVSADARITVRVLGDPTGARAVLDSRRVFPLTQENRGLTIVKSARKGKFIRLHERNYFTLLRDKLSQWTH